MTGADKIIAGLEDAVAHAKGDESRARVTRLCNTVVHLDAPHPAIRVRCEWDDEGGGAWIITSEDVPGLVTTAQHLSEVAERVRWIAPHLLAPLPNRQSIDPREQAALGSNRTYAKNPPKSREGTVS